MKTAKAMLMALAVGGCSHSPDIESRPINEFQFVGTHNSYKLLLDNRASRELASIDPWLAVSLDYGHQSLVHQLDLGLRHLEVDILEDVNGGAYASPALAESPDAPSNADMQIPGFKVLHIPDYDFQTTCSTFRRCLTEIEGWSRDHPNHLPIFVHMNARTRSSRNWPDLELLAELGDPEALKSIDAEVRSVIPDNRLLFASTITGLEKWPSLAESRGRLIFILDGSSNQARAYRDSFEHGELRLLVTDAHGDIDPVDRYTVIMDPREEYEKIRQQVDDGFLVRTLGEFNTIEARRNERARFRDAASSGAQIISIESYFEDTRRRPGFVIDGFDGGGWVRCGPNHPNAPCRPTE